MPIDPESTHLLFQVINDAYEHHSPVITTNVEFPRQGTIISDDTIAAAVFDRLVHHARVLRFTGTSWRLTHALMSQRKWPSSPSKNGNLAHINLTEHTH
nr:ATP-binding protein [Corynebacterium mendelii]